MSSVTEINSTHRIGRDSRWQQSGTTHILIDAIHWLHRPCSAPLWLDKVRKKPGEDPGNIKCRGTWS